jgi:hypothetical protein
MGKTLSELEALGARNGWKVRPLTAEEIRNEMRPDELEYHEKFNAAEVERALHEPARREQNRRNKAEWDALRVWQGQGSPEQVAAWVAEGQKFKSDYPQFMGDYCHSNCDAVGKWVKDRNLPFVYDNLVEGFEDLVLRGELILDGAICGVGDREFSGHELASHNQIYKFLVPHPTLTPEAREQERINNLSADQFKRERKELADSRTPPILKNKVVQILDTWIGQHPEYTRCPENEAAMTDAVLASALPISLQLLESVYQRLLAGGVLMVDPSAIVEHGVSSISDMGGRPQGFPKESEKYSFKMKLRSMSSNEIAERCANDPRFQAALDAIK